jgi:hypothetical protein
MWDSRSGNAVWPNAFTVHYAVFVFSDNEFSTLWFSDLSHIINVKLSSYVLHYYVVLISV